MPTPPIPTTWGNLFRSSRGEWPKDRDEEGEPLRIEGRVPTDLRGDFVAQGPALYTVLGRPVNSWFDGQGGVHRIRLGDLRASFWSRVVESQDWREQKQKARVEINHFAMNSPFTLPFEGVRTFNTANTQVLPWQDKLMACYEGGWPVLLDPKTLASIKDYDLGGRLEEGEHMSAHWHRNPHRKAIYNYTLTGHPGLLDPLEPRKEIGTGVYPHGQRPLAYNTRISLIELPDEGEPRRLTDLHAANYPFLHDFIVTRSYAIFLIPPVYTDVLAMAENEGTLADNFLWKAEDGVQVVVVSLEDPERWWTFGIDAFWLWHFANAYEKDDALVIDYVQYRDYNHDVKDFLLSIHTGRYPATVRGSYLTRLTLPLDSKGAPIPRNRRSRLLSDVSCEFPRVSPAALTREYRVVWMAAHSSEYASEQCPWDTLAKVDVHDGTTRRYTFGSEQIPSEPIFVPRADSDAEDDGYVLNLVYDGLEDRSYLAILDGRKLSAAGPDPDGKPAHLPAGALLAKVHLPTRVPQTFHRVWVPVK